MPVMLPRALENRCDECGGVFLGPVWHCLGCGTHWYKETVYCRRCAPLSYLTVRPYVITELVLE